MRFTGSHLPFFQHGFQKQAVCLSSSVSLRFGSSQDEVPFYILIADLFFNSINLVYPVDWFFGGNSIKRSYWRAAIALLIALGLLSMKYCVLEEG